jgi:hypothetical protein
MIQEEIQERNKQIALMLGWKEATLEYKLKWCNVKTEERLNRIKPKYIPILMKENEEPLFESFLKWDSDWNWLMMAIRFLHKHFESKERSWTSIERYPLYTDIETVFVLVSDFAKHYNEGKL